MTPPRPFILQLRAVRTTMHMDIDMPIYARWCAGIRVCAHTPKGQRHRPRCTAAASEPVTRVRGARSTMAHDGRRPWYTGVVHAAYRHLASACTLPSAACGHHNDYDHLASIAHMGGTGHGRLPAFLRCPSAWLTTHSRRHLPTPRKTTSSRLSTTPAALAIAGETLAHSVSPPDPMLSRSHVLTHA